MEWQGVVHAKCISAEAVDDPTRRGDVEKAHGFPENMAKKSPVKRYRRLDPPECEPECPGMRSTE